MNKSNCGTGNEQSIGCAQLIVSCVTVRPSRKDWWLEILLSYKMGKIGTKI
jgi:hypothetical protein